MCEASGGASPDRNRRWCNQERGLCVLKARSIAKGKNREMLDVLFWLIKVPFVLLGWLVKAVVGSLVWLIKLPLALLVWLIKLPFVLVGVVLMLALALVGVILSLLGVGLIPVLGIGLLILPVGLVFLCAAKLTAKAL